MRLTAALINLALGCVYTSYGVMTLADLRRGWSGRDDCEYGRAFWASPARRSKRSDQGELHFGLAWIAMAFTCGPHHLEHGAHILFGGRGAAFDVVAVALGLPAGAGWFMLRVEAFRGGRGDRVIRGTPAWVAWLPRAAAVYALVAVTWTVLIVRGGIVASPLLTPNVWLLVLYMVIGALLLRTQRLVHAESGNWSLSGLSLTIVFPTCALMHSTWMAYAAAGVYDVHWHLLAIDWLGVPAALYFLWVVRGLYAGDFPVAAKEPVGRLAPV